MVTLTGLFLLPDGTPDTGSVRVRVASPAVLRAADPAMVTAELVHCHLDDEGRIEADLVPSDDPGWATEDPVPYLLQVRTGGLRADFHALITADSDIADLVALDGPPEVVAVPGPPNVLTVAETITGAPGTAADVTISGDTPDQTLTFTIPRGDKGDKGDTGPANVLTVVPTVTGAPGTQADVQIAGDAPAQTLTFTIPRGDTGGQGGIGPVGPPAVLQTGTITPSTLTPGAPVTATLQVVQISPGTFRLDGAFGIPQGQPGALGAYQARTTGYTILGTDGTVAADTTSGAVALVLPSAAANSGKWLRIIKTGGSNTLTVNRAGSETIAPGGKTAVVFPAEATMGEIMLVSSGTGWHVVSGQASAETAVVQLLWKWSQALASTGAGSSVGWKLPTASGTSSPEGSRTGSPGETYVQTNHPVGGVIVWRKATGTGTSGWAVERGDTGIIDMTGVLTAPTGLTIQVMRLRRIDTRVTWDIKVVNTAGSAVRHVLVGSLPAAFRPWQSVWGSQFRAEDGTLPKSFGYYNGAVSIIHGDNSSSPGYLVPEYTTAAPWPTSL